MTDAALPLPPEHETSSIEREPDDVTVCRGHIRSPLFRRVTHGYFVPVCQGLDEDAEWHRDLRAWITVLAPSAVFTGLTAARLAGWWLPAIDRQRVPIFASTSTPDPVVRRSGLLNGQFVRGAEHRPFVLHGHPVDEPNEILLRCSRDLHLLDLIPLVESALRSRHITEEGLREFCERRRPGVRQLRDALTLADARSESPMETLTRQFLRCMGIAVQIQPNLYDDGGRFVARADALIVGTKVLVEYDGAVHREAEIHRNDLRRDRRLAAAGYDRRGLTLDDLIRHPGAVMDELDRELRRRRRPARLDRWRAMVKNSSYDPIGRGRLYTRWATPMEVFIRG